MRQIILRLGFLFLPIFVCVLVADVAGGVTVSVSQFGAKGDGITDDSLAIQAALDSGASTVTIPAGVYIIGNTLKIGSDTTLSSDSNAVLRLADGAGTGVDDFLITNRNAGDTNITVTGGIWDGNSANNIRGGDSDEDPYTGAAMNFFKTSDLTISNLTVRNPEAFFIRMGNVEDFLVEDITLDGSLLRPNQDGIHIGGNSQHGIIRGITGITANTPNDDMIAINADDDVERAINRGLENGPIRDILVEDVSAENAYNFVRILSDTSIVDGVTVRNVSGGCRYYAVNLNEWRFTEGTGYIRNVLLENFDVSMNYDNRSLIEIGLNVANLHISDFNRTDSNYSNTLNIDNAHTNTIRLDGIEQVVDNYTISGGDINDFWLNPMDIYDDYLSPTTEGGSFGASNLARNAGAAPFAIDAIEDERHTIEHLTDGVYGNVNSWIGTEASPTLEKGFVGVDLGGTFLIDSVAFGRDNLGNYSDRCAGTYLLQYTTVENPDETTPDEAWIDIGHINNFFFTSDSNSPGLRHLFEFDPVIASGIRLIVPNVWSQSESNATAIDELEVYGIIVIPGDANGDGRVDGSDVTILAGNWQYGVGSDEETATWSMGDFNGDGKVDGSDVTILASNWQYGVDLPSVSVPEPSGLMILFGIFISFAITCRIKK